jgi:hypothetical protein
MDVTRQDIDLLVNPSKCINKLGVKILPATFHTVEECMSYNIRRYQVSRIVLRIFIVSIFV